jgi:hypothetical protein
MRYWFDMDCLVVHFFAFWGVGDLLTTLTFVHLAGHGAEANPLMAGLIAVHPLLYAVVKVSAAAGVSVLLLHSLGTSRHERAFVALLVVIGVCLVLWNVTYIHALA